MQKDSPSIHHHHRPAAKLTTSEIKGSQMKMARRSTIATILWMLLLLLGGSGAAAFVSRFSSTTTRQNSVASRIGATYPCQPFASRSTTPSYRNQGIRLWAKRDDDDGFDDNDRDSAILSTTTTDKDEAKSFLSEPLKKAFEVIDMVWSYTIIFLGTCLSLGLVLNLFGYGYTFSIQDGLRIDTISQFRTENQFRREAIRLEKERAIRIRATETQPQSLLPK